MTAARHSIKSVARRTGLSAHVIRIWEKRYGAVKPERTGTNRRLYSEEQVERLSLLRELTQAGHSIGAIATLPGHVLKKIAKQDDLEGSHPASGAPNLLEECVSA